MSQPGEALPDGSQQISPPTREDLRVLRTLIADISRRETAALGDDVNRAIAEWQENVFNELPSLDDESDAPSGAGTDRSYVDRALERTASGRTYRVHARIDTRFGNVLTDRVVRCASVMLERIAAGRARCFITNALNAKRLDWRRRPTLPFPHPLPYAAPPPTTLEGQAAEEAAVIAAAFHFPLSGQAPGINLYIDHFSQGPSDDGFWVLGSALVNSYNDTREYRMKLNERAFGVSSFNDNVWAGTIAHEMMHNLGWGHPKGGYTLNVAIVNYDRCVRGTEFTLADGLDEDRMIR